MYDNYIKVCKDILTEGKSEDRSSVADAVSAGYIERREDGSFRVTCPAFNIEQKAELDKIAEKHLFPIIDEYTLVVEKFTDGYKKIFPKHLRDDADRMCHGTFLGMLNCLFEYAQRIGVIETPTEGSFCDVLVQYKA